jgi:hypothetical protein
MSRHEAAGPRLPDVLRSLAFYVVFYGGTVLQVIAAIATSRWCGCGLAGTGPAPGHCWASP